MKDSPRKLDSGGNTQGSKAALYKLSKPKIKAKAEEYDAEREPSAMNRLTHKEAFNRSVERKRRSIVYGWKP